MGVEIQMSIDLNSNSKTEQPKVTDMHQSSSSAELRFNDSLISEGHGNSFLSLGGIGHAI